MRTMSARVAGAGRADQHKCNARQSVQNLSASKACTSTKTQKQRHHTTVRTCSRQAVAKHNTHTHTHDRHRKSQAHTHKSARYQSLWRNRASRQHHCRAGRAKWCQSSHKAGHDGSAKAIRTKHNREIRGRERRCYGLRKNCPACCRCATRALVPYRPTPRRPVSRIVR